MNCYIGFWDQVYEPLGLYKIIIRKDTIFHHLSLHKYNDWVYAEKCPCEIPKIAYLRYLDNIFLRIDPIHLIFLPQKYKIGVLEKIFFA